jgi:hypothetical protein
MSRPQRAFECMGMLTKHSGLVAQSWDTSFFDNPSLPEDSGETIGLQGLKGILMRT